MAGRKRGESLEVRLAAIRTATPEEGPALAESAELPVHAPSIESSDAFEVPESLDGPPHSDAPASYEPPEAFYTFSSIAPSSPASLERRESDVMQVVAEHDEPVPTPLSAAAEGDTFLPGSAAAANRVDVGVAVQAAVRQLWPELEKAEKPVELETKPEETPLLAKLLGRGWKSARRASHERREEIEEASVDEPVADAPAPALDEIDEIRTETTGDTNELEDIIAEIAEITEVVTPAPWKPVRGRIPKPKPKSKQFKKPGPVVDEIAEPVLEPEPVVDEIAEIDEVAVEPETEDEPEPVVDEIVEEPVVEEPVVEEPVVDEIVEEPVVEEPVVEEPVVDEIIEPEPSVEAEPSVEPEFMFLTPEPQPAPLSDEFERDELMSEHASEPEKPSDPTDESPWARPVRKERFGRIGTTLIDRGLITNDQLDEALEIQRTCGKRVGDILVELGALSSFELARVLADHMGVPFTDLRTKPPDPIIAALLPEDVARRYDALAIQRWNGQLVVAMANPTDLFALDDLQMVTRQPIIAAMAVKEDLRAAIDRVYRVSLVETVDAAKVDYGAEAEAAALQIDEADEGPIVGLVNALMGQAITDHASDLHIEPCSTHIAIRMRIDGVLHDSSTVPLELLRPVVSRVKILAGLDIAQNRLAQDGRFSLTIDGRSVDVRVVTMPTAAGEAVILRLLDPIRDALGISSLGLSAAERDRFIPAFTASQGAVFIAGPTGSGKTSTIYAVLSEVNTRTKSIVSVENPVEFRLDGIKQMQINSRAGLTFPTALPTVLRSDPDVVFIGEVRDTDTARIAADAAITGHLVLSTLHATRAASAPMRLVEMGVEPYLVASALTLVASQRLARRLCEHCAEPAEESTIEQLRGLGAEDSVLEGATVRRAVGCPACRGTGHKGRLPIFEIMPVTEAVSRLILDRASRAQIEDVAVEEGMDTMLRAAIKRVVRGDLSVEEMLRVIS